MFPSALGCDVAVVIQETGLREEGDQLTLRRVCVWCGEFPRLPGSFWKLVAL